MAIINWDGDPTALKIILELQRKNDLYEKGISDILTILHQKRVPPTPEYYDSKDSLLPFVFDRLRKLFEPEEPERTSIKKSSLPVMSDVLRDLHDPDTRK